MTPAERKMRLGDGGLTRVAKRTKRTLGHVSQVNKESRRDVKVERAITRAILSRHPEVPASEIWPAKGAVPGGEPAEAAPIARAS